MIRCSKEEVKYIRNKVSGLEERHFRKNTFSPASVYKILRCLKGVRNNGVVDEHEQLYVAKRVSDNYSKVTEILDERHRDIVGSLSVSGKSCFLSFLVLLVYVDWLNEWLASDLTDFD